VGRKLGSIRGRLVAVLAAESTDQLPWMPFVIVVSESDPTITQA